MFFIIKEKKIKRISEGGGNLQLNVTRFTSQLVQKFDMMYSLSILPRSREGAGSWSVTALYQAICETQIGTDIIGLYLLGKV